MKNPHSEEESRMELEETEKKIKQTLYAWSQSLPPKVTLGGLLSRNETAHKWRVTFSLIRHREVMFWRMYDLLRQSYKLHEENMVIGSTIVLRAAIETLCLFIFMNEKTDKLMLGEISFKDFQNDIARLLLGRRGEDEDTTRPFRIYGDVIKKIDKKYRGYERGLRHIFRTCPSLIGKDCNTRTPN